MNRPVRFGILGVGRIVQNAFAPGLAMSKRAVLHAAASRERARAEALSPTVAYGSYEELLEDPDVEAVYIAVHNGLHRDLTLAALERGKHVLCEKPLGRDTGECEEMVAAAERTGLVLLEAFMYRYHPRIHKAVEWANDGAVGRVRTVEASFSFTLRRSRDVRWNREWGGGSLLDVGCYCVNFCRLILGDVPDRVSGSLVMHPQHGVDVAANALLDYDGGRAGVISCGFDGGLRNRALICGTDGVIELPKAFIQWDEPSSIVLRTERGEERVEFPPVHVFREEIDDIARAIREGCSTALAADAGLRNLRVLDAIRQGAEAVTADL